MLNLFCSTASVSYQFLILESSLFQVIFMRNHTKIPFFEGLCYNHKGLELFSKTNFESSWASEGMKICKFVKGGGTKNQTKRVAQNTYSIKFSALQTPRKIQNSFLKRALIPYDYNKGLQIRNFWHDFSSKSLIWRPVL